MNNKVDLLKSHFANNVILTEGKLNKKPVYYVSFFNEDGERKRHKFFTLEGAQKFALKQSKVSDDNILSVSELELVKQLKQIGGSFTLMDCLKYGLKANETSYKTVNQVIDKILSRDEPIFKPETIKWKTQLWKAIRTKFGKRHPFSITIPEIETFLNAKRTINKKVKEWSFTVKKKYRTLMQQIFIEAESPLIHKLQSLKVYGERRVDTDCYTPSQIRQILSYVITNKPYILPCVILTAFAGVKQGEIVHIKWNDVSFELGEIVLRETKTKRPRRMKVSEQVMDWLKLCYALNKGSMRLYNPPRTSEDTVKSVSRVVRKTLVSALDGGAYKPNGLRKAFATYLAAMNYDSERISAKMDNSAKIVNQYYVTFAALKDSQEYFKIHPEQF